MNESERDSQRRLDEAKAHNQTIMSKQRGGLGSNEVASGASAVAAELRTETEKQKLKQEQENK